VVKAKIVKENMGTKLVSQLSQGVPSTKNDISKLVDKVMLLGFALDENQLAKLVEAKDKINEDANNLQDPTGMGEVPGVLDAVHDLHGKLSSLLYWLSRQVVEGAKNYGQLLRTRGLTDDPAIADLEKRAGALSQELDAAAVALDPAKAPYNDKTSADLRSSYRDLLKQTLAPVEAQMDAAALEEIRTFTGNGRYFEAAGRLQPTKATPTVLGQGRSPGAGTPAIAVIPWQPISAPPASGAPVTPLAPGIKAVEPVKVMLARTVRQVLWDKTAQMLIVGAAITVVGYLLFSDNFVGTPKDLAIIFFWGFGLDVSMENILAQAAKLPGPRK
jgi:hypothetical protein